MDEVPSVELTRLKSPPTRAKSRKERDETRRDERRGESRAEKTRNDQGMEEWNTTRMKQRMDIYCLWSGVAVVVDDILSYSLAISAW